jgi:hypothetical protein
LRKPKQSTASPSADRAKNADLQPSSPKFPGSSKGKHL